MLYVPGTMFAAAVIAAVIRVSSAETLGGENSTLRPFGKPVDESKAISLYFGEVPYTNEASVV